MHSGSRPAAGLPTGPLGSVSYSSGSWSLIVLRLRCLPSMVLVLQISCRLPACWWVTSALSVLITEFWVMLLQFVWCYTFTVSSQDVYLYFVMATLMQTLLLLRHLWPSSLVLALCDSESSEFHLRLANLNFALNY